MFYVFSFVSNYQRKVFSLQIKRNIYFRSEYPKYERAFPIMSLCHIFPSYMTAVHSLRFKATMPAIRSDVIITIPITHITAPFRADFSIVSTGTEMPSK